MEEKCCVNCGCDPVLGMKLNEDIFRDESKRKLEWLQSEREKAQEAKWSDELSKAITDQMQDECCDSEESTDPFYHCKKSVQEDCALKGILVFYVDVGSLPPSKAEDFLERCKDRFFTSTEGKDRIKQNHEVVFVPIRSGQGTRVKYIPMN